MNTLSVRAGIVCAVALLLALAGLALRDWQAGAREAEPDAATTSIDELRELIEAGRYADVQVAARELLPIVERRHGRHSIEVAEALDLLSEALRRGGKSLTAETLQTAERAVAIKTDLLGGDPPGVAVSLHHLATVHYNLHSAI